MGVVPDESNLYPELTGFANLSFCGALPAEPAVDPALVDPVTRPAGVWPHCRRGISAHRAFHFNGPGHRQLASYYHDLVPTAQ